MLSVLGIWIRDERKSEESILGRVIYCSVGIERGREEMEEERRKRGEIVDGALNVTQHPKLAHSWLTPRLSAAVSSVDSRRINPDTLLDPDSRTAERGKAVRGGVRSDDGLHKPGSGQSCER